MRRVGREANAGFLNVPKTHQSNRQHVFNIGIFLSRISLKDDLIKAKKGKKGMEKTLRLLNKFLMQRK